MTHISLKEATKRMRKTKTQHAALVEAYALVSARFTGRVGDMYLRPDRLFEKSKVNMWKRGSCLHSTKQNQFVRDFLIESGLFSERDIRFRWTLLYYFSPHQFLEVKVKDRWMRVDPWAAHKGYHLGEGPPGFPF